MSARFGILLLAACVTAACGPGRLPPKGAEDATDPAVGPTCERADVREVLRELDRIGASPLQWRSLAPSGRGACDLVGVLPPVESGSPVDSADSPAVILGASLASPADAPASDVLIETCAELMRGTRPRPVAVALWGSGTDGAEAFVAGPAAMSRYAGAYVGVEGLGRVRANRLVVAGVENSAAWPALVERTNVAAGFDVRLVGEAAGSAAPFARAGIPSIGLATDPDPALAAEDSPAEDVERLAEFTARFVRALAGLPESPAFRSPPSADSRRPGAAKSPYTGTLPDYGAASNGLRLRGVAPGGPAEAAGLREGDVIVALGGHPVSGPQDYLDALEAIVVGQPAAVVYVRDGERRETTITPTARD